MLFKSGENLFEGAQKFISDSTEITLYSAYIKVQQLKSLNREDKISRIVVRWEIKDLHKKSSDLELYHYCQEKNIALFRNTRIHLKCLQNERNEIFFGSANISARGIGEHGNNYNLELNSKLEKISFVDTLYLDKIISQSEYVSEEFFQKIQDLVQSLEEYDEELVYDKIEMETAKSEKDYFLISELPMFLNISDLYESVINIDIINDLDKKCVAHDMVTYGLDINSSKEKFYSQLSSVFNSHPFIKKLKNQVISNQRKSMGYGQVVKWISENTTTVPTPISWELKQKKVVNILYEWICFFDKDFIWETPRHSQVLFYKGN